MKNKGKDKGRGFGNAQKQRGLRYNRFGMKKRLRVENMEEVVEKFKKKTKID